MADQSSSEETLERTTLASEKRYEAIFEQAAVGIVHCALDGHFIKINESFADFLGYKREELKPLGCAAVTFPEDVVEDLSGIGKLLSRESSRYERDKRFVRKDGTVVWGHATLSLMLDEAGQPMELLAVIQNIHDRKMAEEALAESEHRHRVIFENSPLGMIRFDAEGTIRDCNAKFIQLAGASREKLIGFNTARESGPKMQAALSKALVGEPSVYEGEYTSIIGGKSACLRVVFNPVSPGQSPTAVIATLEDIASRRLAEETIERRVLSLTQPLDNTPGIAFEDLFNLEEIQRLQDEFSGATGVASIITRTDGSPITKPSNFTRLCRDIIRKSAKGWSNCCASDAALGRLSKEGPLVRPCLSGGLWDAGSGISVGGQHIANWLIGQVRDETQSEAKIRTYARQIGVDEDEAAEAFRDVPVMSRQRFETVSRALYTLANRLSTAAYHNVLQARFIAEIKEKEDKLRESENRLRFALEGANDGFWDANLPDGTVYFSERSHEILGFTPGERHNLVTDWKSLVHPDDYPSTREKIVDHFKKKNAILRIEHRLRMKNGEWKWVLIRGKVVEWEADGRARRMTGTFTDIDQRKKIEDTQKFLLERYRAGSGEDFFHPLANFLADLLQMDYVRIDRLEGDKQTASTVAVYSDGAFVENISYALRDTPCGQALGKTICCYERDVRRLFPLDAMLQEMGAESYVGTTLWDSRGRAIGLIAVIGRKPLLNPELAESILKLVAIRAAGELERRAAEAEKILLQTQLMQAQKMESVGRLAGGVAHDFNNMLGVILGHVELAQEQLDNRSPLYLDLQEVKKAAERSAALTRQLLAFARKQTISPKILDLNETVEGLLKMLRRLIGEDIDLVWLPGQGLWPVRIDPTQVDQILANLTVNARDAIQGVGRISIETDNVTLDDEYCTEHAGFLAGRYVMLSVSDNGCGMEREIREHIFEPFFTTKEIGKGTGLGLATIYGIAKQNGGFVNVYSEPGQGTTFRLYLPKHADKNAGIVAESVAATAKPGRETILMVEDEPAILQLGKRMLERLGYRVLAASGPVEALLMAEHFPGEIHLLLTDVVMPEMNGRDLARRLLSLYPGIKRLFMSGYTADVIAHHGVLDEGVRFIQKPFSKAELSMKIREALDGL